MFAPALPRAAYNFPPCQPNNSDAISPLCLKWARPASTRLNVALSPSLALTAAAVLDARHIRFFVRCAAFLSAIAVSPTMLAGLSHG